jgi:hypothetical protein
MFGGHMDMGAGEGEGEGEEGGTPGPARWARISRRLHQGLLEMALPA